MKPTLKILLIAIISIFLLIKIIGLGLNIYADETVFALEAKDGFANFGKVVSQHPPIPIFFYSLFGSIFGNSNIAIRFVPLTFSVLALIATYLLAKNLYDKRVAIISVIVMTVTFWYTLASLQVDIDGAILSFMLVCSFLCYLIYEKTMKKKWLFATGIFFGLSILTKIPAVLFIPVLFIYKLISEKSLSRAIKPILLILLMGISLFFFLQLISYITGFGFFKSVIMHATGYSTKKISFMPLVYLMIWGTPLLVITPFLALKPLRKEDIFLGIWCIIPVIFYMLFGIPFLSPYERYLMIVIPPLSILAGKYLSDAFKPKYWLLFLSSLVISYIGLLIINLNTDYLPHNVQAYLENLQNLNWNFYLPITGSSGAVFGLNFASIAIVYILSAILAVLMLTKYKAYSLHLFIGIAVAINLFMVQELVFNIIHPNFNKAISDEAEYFRENNLAFPIYTNQLSFLYYLNLEDGYNQSVRNSERYFWFTYNSESQRQRAMEEWLKTKGGTILVVDYPIIDKKSSLWNLITKCKNRKIFYSKNFPVGYVFEC